MMCSRIVPPQPGHELALHHIESERADEVQGHDGDGEQQQAGARRQADRGRFPDRRSRGESVHRAAAGDDDAGTKKPMPETTWAATRDGSSTIVPVDRTSAKPYLLTSMINADAVPTMV